MAIAPNSIINGDCLEVMRDIDDRSIDCCISLIYQLYAL